MTPANSTVLLELALRVEAASGPDRELDGLIHCAMDSGCIDRRRAMDRIGVFGPRYTASIDAAMTLVPEGWGWMAGWGRVLPDEPMGGAVVTRHARFVGYGANYDNVGEGEAATPALALCAAALRALAAQAPEVAS